MDFASLSRSEKLQLIQDTDYDVVIIGGGIFGACALREAALRGLRALLVEAEDFAAGVSANSFKIVHGGIRYLQHLDLRRLWSSCRERSGFLRVAPHLIHPLPVLVPTYGFGKLGKPFLGAGMLTYDLLTLNKNRGISDSSRHLPFTRFLSREQVLAQFPGIDPEGLTGGCVFHDARFYNPTRLVWEFIKTAMAEGGHAINYVTASDIGVEDGRIVSLQANDARTGQPLSIRCRTVVNATGPWAERFLAASKALTVNRPVTSYSRDACFVVNRQASSRYTLAIQARTKDPDAVFSRPARHVFVSPWRNYTLVGVWHVVSEVDPGKVSVSQQEIEEFIAEINEAYPELALDIGDVLMWNAGLVPFGENPDGTEDLSFGKRSILIDHAADDGIEGFVTVVGIRYTMARDEAERVLSLIEQKLGRKPATVRSDFIRLKGGSFDSFPRLLTTIAAKLDENTEPARVEHIARNYGADHESLVALIREDKDSARVFTDTQVAAADIIHAIRSEMAESLADVVFRRTDVATAGNPGEQVLMDILDIVAREKNWSDDVKRAEYHQVISRFPPWSLRN